ncbi:hypothetical protein H8D85_02270 [bacterium]|nr:hypothetical protein [bacterium]
MRLGLGITIRNKNLLGGFSDPSSISGLQLWFQHNNGLTDSVGNTNSNIPDEGILDSWDYQSGNNNHATGAGGDRPRYTSSDGSVNFKANVKFFSLTSTINIASGEDFSFVFYVKNNNATVNSDTFVGDDTNDILIWWNTSQFSIRLTDATTNNITGGASITSTNYNTIMFVRTSGTIQLYVNGSAWGNSVTDNDAFTITTLGSESPEANNFHGWWKDMSYYNKALSTGEISDLHTYLTNL